MSGLELLALLSGVGGIDIGYWHLSTLKDIIKSATRAIGALKLYDYSFQEEVLKQLADRHLVTFLSSKNRSRGNFVVGVEVGRGELEF